MPLPLTVSCSSKIQIGFTFLVPAHLGSPGQRDVKRACVRVWSVVGYTLEIWNVLINHLWKIFWWLLIGFWICMGSKLTVIHWLYKVDSYSLTCITAVNTEFALLRCLSYCSLILICCRFARVSGVYFTLVAVFCRTYEWWQSAASVEGTGGASCWSCWSMATAIVLLSNGWNECTVVTLCTKDHHQQAMAVWLLCS